MFGKKDLPALEILIYVILMASSALMVLLTARNYSTRVLLGILLSVPWLLSVNLKEMLKAEKKLKLMWIGNLLISVFYGIAGIMFRNLSYLIIAGTISVIVPILQKHFIDRKDEVINRISLASFFFMVFYIILSFLCGRPITTDQFGGVLHNQNALGLICTIVLPAGLILFRIDRYKVIGLITIGITLTFTLFSCSRTAIISNIAQLIYAGFVISLDVKGKRITSKDVMKRIASIILVFLLSFFSLFWLFTTGKTAEAKALPQIQIQEEYQRNLTLGELMSKLYGRAIQGIGDGNLNYNFSSGRMGIWKDYAENIGFFGHEKEEREQVVSGTRRYESTNAHNAYLQLAYGGGLFAGIGLIIVTLLSGYGCIDKSMEAIKKKKISLKNYYTIMTVLGYGATIITSSSWMMYVHLPALFYWIATGCLVVRENALEAQKVENY